MFLFQQCLWQSKMPKAWLCSTLVCFCSIFLYFVLANIEIYRSHTVVIFNLPETEIIPKDLYSEVISFFHNFLEMKHLTESDIVYAARFGRDNRTTQHRPVKVRFFSAEIPKEVFSKRRKLIGTGFVIARPRNGKEIEDLRILSRYEKKLNALYKDIETYITGTSLYIEKISHDADDILRLEKIENATQRQIEKGEIPTVEYEVKPSTNNTIMVHGIKDNFDSDFESTAIDLVDFFRNHMSLELEPMWIVKANRIGYLRKGCRSILVRFINSKIVSDIIKRRTYLAGTNFYVSNFLCREDLDKSKILRRYMHKLRRGGNDHVKLFGAVLYFDGRAHTAEDVLELEKNETLSLLKDTKLTTKTY